MLILVSYLHYLGMVLMGATAMALYCLLRRQQSAPDAVVVKRLDAGFSAAVILTLATGLMLGFGLDTSAAAYLTNGWFQLKLGLFVLLLLISAFPTVYFWLQRNSGQPMQTVPVAVLHIIRVELLVTLILPLLSVLI